MAEQRSTRSGDAKGPRPPSESHLRLVGADGQVVFEDAAHDTDESPTIISKNARPPESASVSSDGSSIRGRKLAHFELIEPIGVGGMAAVLRARDTQLDRIVALKILPPPMAKDPENIRRFHQEARAAAKLDHENIARVFFCGEDQGLHFIAFEYVEGDNLRVILERRGRVPVAESIRYILQVATGLEHSASRNVVHRDVKPSNIIITPTGRAKLVDMGLARSLEPHDDNGLTQSGVTLGTFDYISPEQALEPRDADSRSDLYSLGCTFYHMLTGQAPVPEGTAARKLHHHQHVAPTDPRQINPDIPDEVAFIVGKLMAKNPRERFQRPALLVQHLMSIAQKYGAAQDLPEPLFVDVNLPTDPGHRPLVLVSLAALLLAGLLFLLSLSPSDPRHNVDPPPPVAPQPNLSVAPPPQPPAVRLADVIRSEAELAAALDKAMPGQPLLLNLEGSIDPTGNLAIRDTKADKIELAVVPRSTAKLTFAPTPGIKKEQFGLRISCRQPVTFKGISFDVGPKQEKDAVNRYPVAGVVVAAPATVVFERCRFTQDNAPLTTRFLQDRPQEMPIASILCELAKDPSSTRPNVIVKESFFATGQSAIAMSGGVAGYVTLQDCGFADVSTLVHLRSGMPWVKLDHCSAFLRNGPTFRIDGDTAPKLIVKSSLFATPQLVEPNSEQGDEPNLIHQVGTIGDPNRVLYQGDGNGFQNLRNLWVRENQPIGDIDLFRNRLAEPVRIGWNKDRDIAYDKKSISLSAGPPLLFAGDAVRNPDDPSPIEQFTTGNGIRDLVTSTTPRENYPGVRTMLGFLAHTDLKLETPPAGPAPYKPAPNESVVDGAGSDPGAKLRALVEDAKPDQVFLLKPGPKDARFKLHSSVDIKTDVTLKAYDKTDMPIVTIDEKFLADASMFRFLSGSLTLEGLQLELDPGDDRFESQSLAVLTKVGTLTLRDCIVTLRGRAGDKSATPLCVAAIGAPDEMGKMMLTPAGSSPRVILEKCTIRGEGDLVTLRASRPMDLQIKDSLVYLQGSVVQQQQGAAKQTADGDVVSIRVDHSAILTDGATLQIHAGKSTMPRFQHPYRIVSTDSLFARLGDQPIVLLDLPDVMEKTVPQLVDWRGQQGERGDAFVNFGPTDPVLTVSPAENGIAPQFFEREWQENYYKTPNLRFFGADTIRVARPLRLSAQDPAELVSPTDQTEALMPYLDVGKRMKKTEP
jgi:serine/threonine protein kinase